MTHPDHILVIDPIAYPGGSKVATRHMLDLLNTGNTKATVVTADPDYWADGWVKTSPLYEPQFLAHREQGPLYFLKHLVIVLSILYVRVRWGKFQFALGASGPGVDLSLYLVKKILPFKLIQIIHGPVAKSRTIARALSAADAIFYLESTRESLVSTLTTRNSRTKALQLLDDARFELFTNGLPPGQWPTKNKAESPTIFWAASLLKWKGLDLLLRALKQIPPAIRPKSHICYIRPRATRQAVSQAPVAIDKASWHESPGHLDGIRAQCNIFVSTSEQEPFGLSILEAMAANHCILIPQDGAYWDTILQHGINCIKYRPGDANDLAGKLLSLSRSIKRITSLGSAAGVVALDYQTQTQYAHIKKAFEASMNSADIDQSQQSVVKVKE